MSRPIKEYQSGGVKLAVWENEYDGKTSFSFTFKKDYKTKDGEWKTTSSYNKIDLYEIMNLCQNTLMQLVKEREQVVKNNAAQKHGDPYQKNDEDVPF